MGLLPAEIPVTECDELPQEWVGGKNALIFQTLLTVPCRES